MNTPAENITRSLPPLSRRQARQREHLRWVNDQLLAWRVQDVLVGRGMTQWDFSIAGGEIIHTPQVISVVAGPPVRVTVRTLPGQTPDDYAQHATAIAYNLGVAEVRVLPLGPSLIGLELVPRSA